MPLCSCGVIPTAIGLHRDGASRGSATGFLISTPQTGVDSILVAASFLGWPFALFKVGAALVSGLTGGLLVNALEREEAVEVKVGSCCSIETPPRQGCCPTDQPQRPRPRWLEALHFGLIDLLKDIYLWVVAGVLVAAAISAFVPAGRLSEISWTQGLAGMVAMLVISLPMYICATASVPLAASLVGAGMSPGAALVLLMAGPTTNVATMGAIYRTFGSKTLGIYLATVAVMSIVLGMTFDWLIAGEGVRLGQIQPLPQWFTVMAAGALLVLFAVFAVVDLRRRLARPGADQCPEH